VRIRHIEERISVNVVFLSSESIHQIWLINEIHSHHPVAKVFWQRRYPGLHSWEKRIPRLMEPRRWRFYAREFLRRLLFRDESRQQNEFERGMFFPFSEPVLDPSIPRDEVVSFNEPAGVDAVRAENPDVIVVFGTEILKGDILDVAEIDILNIHRDILPDYRGGGMPFWVFYNNDFDTLGTTIHKCVASLDAGHIVGQARYPLQPDDSVITLRQRTTALSLQVLDGVLDQYEAGTVDYIPQSPSRLYKGRDLTILKEIKARRNLNRHLRQLGKKVP
jgi:hypothetical protein